MQKMHGYGGHVLQDFDEDFSSYYFSIIGILYYLYSYYLHILFYFDVQTYSHTLDIVFANILDFLKFVDL